MSYVQELVYGDNSKTLTFTEKSILARLAAFVRNVDSTCYRSYSQLAMDLNLNVSTIGEKIRSLIAKGYLIQESKCSACGTLYKINVSMLVAKNSSKITHKCCRGGTPMACTFCDTEECQRSIPIEPMAYTLSVPGVCNESIPYNKIKVNKEITICEVSTSPLAVSEEISCVSGKLSEVAKLAVKPTSAACQEVFAYWQTVMNYSRAKLDKIRKKVIDAALKDFEVADLKMAIDGCAKSPFFMGTNDRHTKYNGIKVIFGRGAERIEHFIEVAKGNSHEYKPSYEI